MCAALLLQEPEVIQVGRVQLVVWPEQVSLGGALAEYADGATHWPGLPEAGSAPVRLVVAPSRHVFDSVTRGRVPEWGVGAAHPSLGLIILRPGPNLQQVLRHELAHVELRRGLGVAMPRWFEEGYASRAAEEWSRLDSWRINWRLLLGGTPSFREINVKLRQGSAEAETGYAMAMSALTALERLGGDGGLDGLFATVRSERDLDRALRITYGMTLAQFEAWWVRDLRSRFGWLRLLTSVTTLWIVVAVVVVLVWLPKRRRNRARRAALDKEIQEELAAGQGP